MGLLQSKFKNIQGYTENPCLRKKGRKEEKGKEKENIRRRMNRVEIQTINQAVMCSLSVPKALTPEMLSSFSTAGAKRGRKQGCSGQRAGQASITVILSHECESLPVFSHDCSLMMRRN